nr:prepilin-type N-terminal cleavage/methylation domain-containing protein [uncultured Draconibacterium sp.]
MKKYSVNKKIKAFTLVELSITLVLSLIVIGMMYLALQIITQQINRNEDKKLEDIVLVKMAFNNAFYDCNVIRYDDEADILICNDSLKTYYFSFYPDQILYYTSNNSNKDLLFKGQYTFDVENLTNEMIAEIIISFPSKVDTLQLSVKKQYSSATLLNSKYISFEY